MINGILKNLGRLCILATIVAGPWRNGAFEPQYLRGLIYLTIASSFFALLSLWTTPSRVRKLNSYWPAIWLSVPLLLGLSLGVLQVIPFSEATLEKLSPHIVEMKRLMIPPKTELTLEMIHGEDGEALLAEKASDLSNLAESERLFNERVFPYEEDDKVDVAKALAIDSAIDNSFLTPDKKGKLTDWGQTISVYSAETRQFLPMFWTGLILFLSSSVLFNTSESRRVLFKTVIFTGLVLALVCISLKANPSLFDFEKYDYWWLSDDKDSYGPYINKNAAAGYLVLCFGACLYYVAREFMTSSHSMCQELEERRREKSENQKETIYKRFDEPLWKVVLGDVFELFNRRLSFWLGVLGLLYASILASMSRGASVSATVILVVAILLMTIRKESRRFWYVPLTTFIIAFAALISVSMYKNVDARMSTLIEEDERGNTAVGRDLRWENWRAALETSKDYPWIGSGLGSYRFANFRNDKAKQFDRLFFYAENSFIQTLLEMGRLGLALLTLEYLGLFIAVGRFLKGRHSVDTTALAISAIAIILGQIFTSSVDFGIYLPANLFLFAVLCGASIGRQNKRLFENLAVASSNREKAKDAVRENMRLTRLERLGLGVFSFILLATTLCCFPALRENADYIVRRNLLRASEISEDKLPHMSVASIDRRIKELSDFVARRDDSYEVRNALANLRLLRFRLQYADFLRQRRPEDSPEKLWNDALPELYLFFFLDNQWRGLKIPTEAVRKNNFITETYPDVVTDLLASRRIFPINTTIYSALLGTLPLASDMSWEEERELADMYARRTAVLGPYDAKRLLRAGCLLGGYKMWSLQKRVFRKTLDNNSTYAPIVLQAMGESMSTPVLVSGVEEVLPDNPRMLCKSVNSLLYMKETPLFRALVQRTEKYFSEVADDGRDSAFYYWYGYFHYMLGEYETAQEALAKSYELDNTNDDSFFLRAQILCDHSSVLMMDEECVKVLKEYCESHHGQKLWQASELLEKAQTNLKKNVARLEARRHIREERESDERIKKKIEEEKSSKDSETSVDEAD